MRTLNHAGLRVLCAAVLLIALTARLSYAATRVEHVRFEQQGDKVLVFYDLHGSEEAYTITLKGSSDGGKRFDIVPKTLSGDVGENVSSGTGKQIVWEALKDVEKLIGGNFVFAVTASWEGGGMEMMWIEPGTFTMGSPSWEPDRDSDEGPQHKVTISRGFWLGKYEITQGQWEAVMGTRPWAGRDYVTENPNNPAVYISWNDVQAFITKLNKEEGSEVYRLPTEAEWEYACRAGTTTRWSFGEDESQLPDYAWYHDNAWKAAKKYARAVGTKLPNPWRLYDIYGNVCEWCSDWYDSSYYSKWSLTDPTGPPPRSRRIYRGGGFDYFAKATRSADRDGLTPVHRRADVGARLVREGQ